MGHRLTLFVIEGMPANEKARETLESLRKYDPALSITVEPCEPSMEELFECPFVRDQDNRGYFGLSGIEWLEEIYSECSKQRCDIIDTSHPVEFVR